MPTKFAAWLVGLFVGFIGSAALADVKLPNLFSDHMVLQREMKTPIWGEATAEEKVTVKFRGQEFTAVADAKGQWRVTLDSLKAGGPDDLTVSGKNTITLKDVLVGDVWVGSGQSNMQGSAGGYAKNDPVLADMIAKDYPQIRLLKGGANGKWGEATTRSLGGYSAILFAFGARLHAELKVPIGLMEGSVGGTPSGYWLTADMLAKYEPAQTAIKQYATTHPLDAAKKKYETELAAWEKANAAAVEKKENPPKKPNPPLAAGECRGKIGNLYDVHIKPFVGYGIRGVLWDQGESGTAIEGLDQFNAMGALIGGWRAAWGQGNFPFIYVQKPSGGGPAWDPENPMTNKSDKFAALPPAAGRGNEGAYRELHFKIREYPNTAMATASDLGPGIHPTNKSGYGARAAQVAMGLVYGKSGPIYGPTYKSHAVDGNKIRLQMDNVGQGLAFKHGEKLQGFSIAGEDKIFHWAEATIDGNAIIVTSSAVAKPIAVRYAWGNTHPWANLFNKDGLPAQTFRTDSW